MTSDLVTGVLAAADQQALLQAVAELKAKLPFLIDLTPEDRRALPKLGDKSRAVVVPGQNGGVRRGAVGVDYSTSRTSERKDRRKKLQASSLEPHLCSSEGNQPSTQHFQEKHEQQHLQN